MMLTMMKINRNDYVMSRFHETTQSALCGLEEVIERVKEISGPIPDVDLSFVLQETDELREILEDCRDRLERLIR